MKCPSCESSNRPGAQKCKRCAVALPRNCLGCGTVLTGDNDLCRDCRTERVPAALGSEELLDEKDLIEENPIFTLRPRFVGRRTTLDRLMRIWNGCAAAHEVAFISLIGPPGVGKSRLLREFAETALAQTPEARILTTEAFGPQEPPYAPFVRVLSARFGIGALDSIANAQDKILAGVGEVMPAARVAEVGHLLAHMLRVPFAKSPIVEPLAESPQQLEARTFIALRRFLGADAAKTPLLIGIDDVERAGPETVNLLQYLAAGLGSARVLLVAAARPALFEAHPTFGEGDVTLERVEVGPLSPDESEKLLTELLTPTEQPPPADLARHVKDRLGGSPRSIFELVRLLLESDVIRYGGGSWLVDKAAMRQRALPASHDEILAARIAAMAPAERDLLEKAAACGDSAFWLDAVVALVRAVALGGDPDGPTLGEIAVAGDATRVATAEAFGKLVEREFIAENPTSQIPGEREYRFAYPSLWELVYSGKGSAGMSGIDEQTRRRYHRLIAQWLELRPEGRGEEAQEEVGRHLERAGDGESAAARYRRAGAAARARFYNEKAIRLYAQALQCLGEGDIAARVHLWHDLGSVYAMRGDYEAALGAFERMLRLSWVVASRSKGAVAFNKMGRVWRQKADLNLALEYLTRGLELFQQAGDERGVAGSLDDIGQVLWLLGRYDQALDHSLQALEKRRRFGDKRSIALSLSNVGNIQKDRGLFTESQGCYGEALELRRAIDDKAGVVTSLNNLGVLGFERGDKEQARKYWEQALQVSEEIGALPLQALVLNNLGELALHEGKTSEARQRLEETLALAKDLEDRRLTSEATRNLGLLELRSGQTDKAREMCIQALSVAETAGMRDYVGRALLALGEVHAATLFDSTEGGGKAPAEDFFTRGISLFRELGNEAELAKGLARFGRYKIERGEVPNGRGLITEARGIFQRLGMKGEDLEKMLGELGA